MPNDHLNNEERKRIFSIRNKMINIPANFVSRGKNTNKCICTQTEDMEHIYKCIILNEQTPEIKFEEIYGDNITKIKKIQERLKNNLDVKNRKEKDQISHVIPYGDPPYSRTIVYGNG